MATKIHPTEKELCSALEIKRKSGESDKAFQAKLHKAAMECDKDVWENLTDSTQGWVNAVQAYHDQKEGKEGRSTYPKDYDDVAQSDPKEEKADKKSTKKHTAEEDTEESKEDKDMSTKKAKSNGKTKKAAPAKPAKAEKKAAAAPAKKAKSTNGKVGATPEWLKTLGDIGAKGTKGATGEEIEKICGKHGVRPFYARFVRAGYLERVERGVYALSAKGKQFIKDAA